jgi:AAA domain
MISSAQELLKRHGIPYVTTKKSTYTTTCPECRRGYLSVKIDAKGATWLCHQCGYGGPRKDNGGGDGGGDLGPIKATFDYQDEDGRRLFQVLKFEPLNSPKTFRQRVGPEQEKWSIKGVRFVPFRLPELIEDLASDHVVFVVEGEKDVETLRAHGIPATCNPMGAGKWWSLFNEIFKGGDIILCGDNDAPGRNHVKLVASNLRDVVRRLRILDLAKFWPEIEESDDISDWFAAGGTVERLWEMVEQLSDAGDCDGRDDGDGGGANASARDWEDGDPGAEQSLDEWDAGDDPGAIPPRQWLLGNQFCRGFISSVVAAGGVGKSALRLVQFISLAIGRPLCGQHVFCRSRVLLISLEDDRGELQRPHQSDSRSLRHQPR